MAETGNPFFDAAERVGERLARMEREARLEAERVVPFGMQPSTASGWREQVEANMEFRQKELERMGQKEFLKRFRGRKNG